MPWYTPFQSIVHQDEPLAMHTWFQVGGMAEFYAQPSSGQELIELVRAANQEGLKIRLLGEGSNVLIREDGVSGLIINLDNPAFQGISINGSSVRAAAAAKLNRVITTAVHVGLGGLEDLIGIPGTLGGALHLNASANMVNIGRYLQSAVEMDFQGNIIQRTAEELVPSYRNSSLNSLVILEATFELEPENPVELAKQLQKRWILKKAQQPMSFQCCGRIFQNPSGFSAGDLIDRAGLKGTRIGGAVVSERHANFFIAEPECTADDLLRLIDLVRDQVHKRMDTQLELDLEIW